MMKRVLFLWIGFAITAQAGTMGAISEPWNGYYLGGNFGPDWGLLKDQLQINNTASNTLFYPPSLSGVEQTGSHRMRSLRFTGGAQVGVNRVFKHNIVAGVELSYDAVNLSQSITNVRQYTHTSTLNFYSMKTDASASQLLTLRPRLGWNMGNLLPYVTAGGALTNMTFQQTFKDVTYDYTNSLKFNKVIFGWVAGGGMEYRPWHNFGLKLEYLYNGFSNQTISHSYVGTGLLGGLSATGQNTLSRIAIQTVLVGVNYFF